MEPGVKFELLITIANIILKNVEAIAVALITKTYPLSRHTTRDMLLLYWA